MPVYNPPLRDMQFVMHELLNVTEDFKSMPQHADTDVDTVNAVLEEAGKFATQVIFPLNISGDTEGCTLDIKTHEVTTPKGFKEAYKTYVEGGWAALVVRPRVRWPGLAAGGEPVCVRNDELGQPGLDHVPRPDARRLRFAAHLRHR